jgi:ribose/xylose/arabinose/galactoside ABC-type transport system permease subunit
MMSTNNDAAMTKNQKDGRSLKGKAKSWGNNISLLIALVAICIVMGATNQYFWTGNNWMLLLLAGAILIIRASGATVAMLTGGMDISQNSVGAFAAISVATLAYAYNFPLGVALVLVIAMGVGMGALNGLLIANLKISPLIATMGTMNIFRGLAWVVNEKTQIVKDPVMIEMGRGRMLVFTDPVTEEVTFPGLPYAVIIALGIFFFIYWLLKYTAYGRKVYMVGGNENASYLSGINATKVKFVAYLISGVTAAYAGFIMACQVGAALPQAGAGTEMNTIAAIVLGGLSLSGGKGTMVGTMLGILILTVISNGLDLNGVQTQPQLIVVGIVLILAVLLDVVRSGALKKQ